MEIFIIGLGAMGSNLALNLISKGYFIRAYDENSSLTNKLQSSTSNKLEILPSIEKLFQNSKKQKLILISLPVNSIDECINDLMPYLNENDIIADLGNTFYLDSKKRADKITKLNIHFLGIGVSGGPSGAKNGPSIMAGGSENVWAEVKKIFENIAAKKNTLPACVHFGKPENGHLVKMVHNGIEYAFMQTLSEVLTILKYLYNLNELEQKEIFLKLSKTNIGCYLLDITSRVISKKNNDLYYLDIISNVIGQNGTGAWTINTSLDLQVSVPSIYAAVSTRILSADFKDKLLKQNYRKYLKLKINDIHDLIMFNFVCCMFQGLSILEAANKKNNQNINIENVFTSWSAGCILQGCFLDFYKSKYKLANNHNVEFMFKFINSELKNKILNIRDIIATSTQCSVPIPVISASLNYYDSIFSKHKIGQITQLQRNYFGNHKLINKNTNKYFSPDWNEENE